MGALSFDFTNVEEKEFGPLPAGEYNVYVFDVKQKISNSGNEMLQVTFSVADGEYTGRKFNDFMVLTQNALWRIKAFLSALGFDTRGVVRFNKEDLLGTCCKVEVVVDGDYNKVKRFKAADVHVQKNFDSAPF